METIEQIFLSNSIICKKYPNGITVVVYLNQDFYKIFYNDKLIEKNNFTYYTDVHKRLKTFNINFFENEYK